jgi:6-pyruvoyltetrahydropterin/6-carboxytetrahydropterin synthase
MPTVTVTRRVHFNAAHRLHSPRLTEEDNQRVFGPCANPNYHGHNYELDISVEGPVDPVTGYVVDLGVVKRIAEETVIAVLDHKNLNLDVPAFRELNPTAENIAVVIWHLLADALPGRLVKIVLWETPRNYVEYRGPGTGIPNT